MNPRGYAVAAVLALVLSALLVFGQGPYLVLACNWDDGELVGVGYAQPADAQWSELSEIPAEDLADDGAFPFDDMASQHCRERRDAVHPVLYDYQQKLEFIIWGDYTP